MCLVAFFDSSKLKHYTTIKVSNTEYHCSYTHKSNCKSEITLSNADAIYTDKAF